MNSKRARPLIGLNCDWREAKREEAFLKAEYLRAVTAAGGVPLLLAPTERVEDADRLAGVVDGLVLIGGDDLDARSYGEAPHPTNEPLARVREAWDFALLRAAERRRVPTLAICCGIQLLNVHRGGSLVQDLPSQVGGQVVHRVPGGPYPFHRVRVAAGSFLHRLVGAGELEVNSQHHQSTGRLGAGLRPTAWSEDGVIEAVEDPEREFLVGVQWHPERLRDRASHLALFEGLIATAKATSKKRSRLKGRARPVLPPPLRRSRPT
ncbi:MAG: gamma-glutamyl-gamma-aminobutyrate hydrolase family protein [Planctomycetes bacterium]|nr:gamma-glutamyl-gamma-aminobutyrate hydrolase family protein [Planctomycetota bacterium]